MMYAKGEGVPKDNVEAVEWVRKAAEQGLENAKEWLRKNAKEKTE
jgi:TPR repeat protein